MTKQAPIRRKVALAVEEIVVSDLLLGVDGQMHRPTGCTRAACGRYCQDFSR